MPLARTPQVSAASVQLGTEVLDRNGRFVTGLERINFKIFEDGIEQDIVEFAPDSEDASVAIVTAFAAGEPERAGIEAMRSFAAGARPGEQFSWIRLDPRPEVVLPWASAAELQSRIQPTANTAPMPLLEGIELAVAQLKSEDRRGAVVLVTDGSNSAPAEEERIRAIIDASRTPIYILGAQPNGASSWLNDLAARSGGAFVEMGSDALPTELSKIRLALQTGYKLTFNSKNAAIDGAWRSIRVEVEYPRPGGFSVRHKAGYFAPGR